MNRAAAGAAFLATYLAGQGASIALTGLLGGRRGGDQSRRVFEDLPTPDWAPPAPVYGLVWTGLAMTSSLAAWRVWQAGQDDPSLKPQADRALALWAAAVVPRSAYTPLAFGQRRLWAATASAGTLAATWTAFALEARQVDRLAGRLAAPEAVWTTFATFLSGATARRDNRSSG